MFSDWHMRVPCTYEEAEGKRRKEEQDEIILNRLTQRILLVNLKFFYSIYILYFI